jgi:hypothetical protein
MFLSSLIKRHLQYQDYVAWDDTMILKNIEMKVVAYSRYNLGTCLRGLRKTTKHVSRDSWCAYHYVRPIGSQNVKSISYSDAFS